MPRNRIIKVDFFSSEQVTHVSRDARLAFLGLAIFADDAGVHPANPAKLRSEVFPEDDDMTPAFVQQLVEELVGAGLVLEYDVDGKGYWQIPTLYEHNRPFRPSFRYPQQVPVPLSVSPGEKPRVSSATKTKKKPEEKELPLPEPVEAKDPRAEPPPPSPPGPTRVDPNFDPAVEHAWEEFCRIQSEVNPDKNMRRTPKRTWALHEALDVAKSGCTLEEMLAAWEWMLSSNDEAATSRREKWNGIDTFLSEAAKYVELHRDRTSATLNGHASHEAMKQRTEEQLRQQKEREAEPEDDLPLPLPVEKKKTPIKSGASAVASEQEDELAKLRAALRG